MSRRTFNRILGWGTAVVFGTAIGADYASGALKTILLVVFVVTVLIVVGSGLYKAYSGWDNGGRQ